jgi:hypothetical protein
MTRSTLPACLLLLAPVVMLGCGSNSLEQRRMAAVPAVSALRDGAFERAGREAESQVDADSGNPYARLVRAIVRYERSMHQTSLDVRTVVIGGLGASAFNTKYLHTSLEQAESDLASVEDDLATAATDPSLAIELCIACWEIDWNGNGRIDEGDRLLFQIERDADDHPLAADDPRRKPTFRFDAGDVAWARAFVSFQRALLDVVLAYDWADLDRLLGPDGDARGRIVLRLAHPDRIAQARQRTLDGLDRSDDARRAYLAETDDDREWVPSPRQKSHPLPLPVDQPLYDTWEAMIGDLRRLVRGEEGLAVADLVKLGEDPPHDVPRGYIDVGGMLSHPHDIVLTPRDVEALDRGSDPEAMLSALLGDHYVASMRPSPLPGRLARMKGEIARHEEGLERKLRYLFWLN